MKYLVIFHTFSGLMHLEKIIKKRGMNYETMPAPRELSTDCGVSIVFESDDITDFIETIDTHNIHRIYHKAQGYTLIYEND